MTTINCILQCAHGLQGISNALYYAGLPDEDGRLAILKIHTKLMAKNGKLGSDVDLPLWAQRTKNFSGAELEGLVRSAQATAMNKLAKVRFASLKCVEPDCSLFVHVLCVQTLCCVCFLKDWNIVLYMCIQYLISNNVRTFTVHCHFHVFMYEYVVAPLLYRIHFCYMYMYM